ncbi:MAG TPA: hypothetical protein VFJ57_11735 [Solirubrobacterales bacterium]|nr:hypothetical protein [Solirubrobacterales bacterium]
MAAVLKGEAQLASLTGELVRPGQQALVPFGCAGDRQLAEQLPGGVGHRGGGVGVFVGVDSDRDHSVCASLGCRCPQKRIGAGQNRVWWSSSY